MSGHSKWSTIKHQKGVTDARRGQLFTKLAREITVAARHGGENPDSNVRLRLAVQKARENNMPLDNVERAVKRGVGGAEGGGDLEEALYEGYGPGGVAIMLQALTDNRKRTVSDVRASFTRAGGSLGEAGCVSWNFEPRGVVTAEVDPDMGEEIALAAIDVGAEGLQTGRLLPRSLHRLRKLGGASQRAGGAGRERHVRRAFHGASQHSYAGRSCRRSDSAPAGPPGGAGRRSEGVYQRRLP